MLTDQMRPNVLTKPFMGIKWREMRANIMNFPVNYDDETEWLATPQGCYQPMRDMDHHKGHATVSKKQEW